MRRFVTLAILLLFTVPFGISIAGCSKKTPITFCNGQDSGVVVGQTTTLNLEPRLTGISLNQGEIGRASSPSGKDCKGEAASVIGVVYGSTDITLADITPQDGRICAGTWNRNSGGGVPDFTTCTPTTRQGTAYITASAQGVTSNAIPVYIHPIVTSIILGPASTNCVLDPASNCAFDATQANGCSAATPTAVTAYTGNACLSQGQNAQLAARVYKGTNVGAASNNISCLVGPLSFSALNGSVVTIDQTGLATARQPGSSTINANISQSSSTAGFFSTCPPASIVLTVPGQTAPPTAPIAVNQNTAQTLIATVKDILGAPLTNISLEYVSTSPTTIPAAGNIITPTFPGAASITAICQPPTCNGSPFNEIGLFNNGTSVYSNPVQITASGVNSSTVIYIGSTQSQYILPVDFTQPTQPSPVRLPYVPNSMVLSQDLSTIYLGSANELMVFSTGGNSLAREDTSVSGSVLAVSPDNGTVVISDPVRQLTYLYLAGGGIASEYGGVGTRAQWTPDSQNVYITTADNRLLVHSNFIGWTSVPLPTLATDLSITVPNLGVYLAGVFTEARTNCPVTTVSGTGLNQQTSNVFYPQADQAAVITSRIAATNDGVHILGANPLTFSDLQLAPLPKACPPPPQAQTFSSTIAATPAFTGFAATAITNVLPTSDSTYAFVTYQGTGGVVPQYVPSTKALTNITLQKTAAGQPIAPLNGVVASDNQTVYVGTSGDNVVHRLTRTAAGFADTLSPIVPLLPGVNGGTAAPDLIVQRPRKSNN